MEEKNIKDENFLNLADEFINLANEKAKQVGNDKISAALLYAASRYNVFMVEANTTTKQEFEAERANALQYFTEHYDKMFNDNFDEYLENYRKES